MMPDLVPFGGMFYPLLGERTCVIRGEILCKAGDELTATVLTAVVLCAMVNVAVFLELADMQRGKTSRMIIALVASFSGEWVASPVAWNRMDSIPW